MFDKYCVPGRTAWTRAPSRKTDNVNALLVPGRRARTIKLPQFKNLISIVNKIAGYDIWRQNLAQYEILTLTLYFTCFRKCLIPNIWKSKRRSELRDVRMTHGIYTTDFQTWTCPLARHLSVAMVFYRRAEWIIALINFLVKKCFSMHIPICDWCTHVIRDTACMTAYAVLVQWQWQFLKFGTNDLYLAMRTNCDSALAISRIQIHWASKETYHFFRVSLHRLGKFILNKHIWKNKSLLQSKRRNAMKSQEVNFQKSQNSLPFGLGVRSRQKPVRRLRNPPLKLNVLNRLPPWSSLGKQFLWFSKNYLSWFNRIFLLSDTRKSWVF